jgi:hypothetical protein
VIKQEKGPQGQNYQDGRKKSINPHRGLSHKVFLGKYQGGNLYTMRTEKGYGQETVL